MAGRDRISVEQQLTHRRKGIDANGNQRVGRILIGKCKIARRERVRHFFVGGDGVVSRCRRISNRNHIDLNDARCRPAVPIADGVVHGVDAIEARVGRIVDRAIGIDDDGSIGGYGHRHG